MTENWFVTRIQTKNDTAFYNFRIVDGSEEKLFKIGQKSGYFKKLTYLKVTSSRSSQTLA